MTSRNCEEGLRLALNITIELSDGRRMTSVFSRNVSEKGFFLEVDPVIAPGETVRLSFRLPTRNRLLHVDGIVIWSQDSDSYKGASGIGVEFLNPHRDFIEELRTELKYFAQ